MTHGRARELLATALGRLGHGYENGTWRNYLRGASELRDPIAPPPPDTASPQVLSALTIEQLFDSIGVRINGPKAWVDHLTTDWVTPTSNGRVLLSNGALILIARSGRPRGPRTSPWPPGLG